MTRDEIIKHLKTLSKEDDIWDPIDRDVMTAAIEELERPHIDLPFEMGSTVYFRWDDGPVLRGVIDDFALLVFDGKTIYATRRGQKFYATREEAEAAEKALKAGVDE